MALDLRLLRLLPLLLLGLTAADGWSVELASADELHARLKAFYDGRDMVALRRTAELVIAQRPEGAFFSGSLALGGVCTNAAHDRSRARPAAPQRLPVPWSRPLLARRPRQSSGSV